MPQANFPLQVFTHYSVGEAFCQIDKLVARAKDLGFTALAITDRHTLSGVPEFLQTIQKVNHKGQDHPIKPIVGCQVRVDGGYFLTLYCQNLVGWKNLIKVLGCSQLNEKLEAQVTVDDVCRLSAGLICGIGGANSVHKHPDYALFENLLNFAFADRFFDFAVDSDWDQDEEINKGLPDIARQVTTPVYYVNKEDNICQRIQVCGKYEKTFQTYSEIFEDHPHEKLFWDSEENYLRDAYPSVPSCFDSVEIFDISAKPNIPAYCENSREFLKELCRKGWVEKNLQQKLAKTPDLLKVYVDRVKMELEVFCHPSTNLADYILVIYDVMKFVREQGSLGGLRGSASACLVSYLIGVSDVDPVIPDATLPYHPGRSLIFERFYNKGRLGSPADIDIDLCPSFRPQVKEYLAKRWGEANVAPYIVTYNRLDGRGAIKQVMRVLGTVDSDTATSISTRMLPKDKIQDDLEDIRETKPGYTTVEFNIDNVPDITNAAAEYPEEFALAVRMSDTIVSAGKHAAAIVISATPIRDSYPIILTDLNEAILGVEMAEAEFLGATKYDLLCVAAYEKILRIFEMINTGSNEPIVVEDLNEDGD